MAVKRRWDPPRTGGTPDRWQQEEGHTQAGAKSQGLVAETARTTGLVIFARVRTSPSRNIFLEIQLIYSLQEGAENMSEQVPNVECIMLRSLRYAL